MTDRQEALALHVEAMGYPNAAALIRAGDDVERTVNPGQRRLPLDELPGQAELGA